MKTENDIDYLTRIVAPLIELTSKGIVELYFNKKNIPKEIFDERESCFIKLGYECLLNITSKTDLTEEQFHIMVKNNSLYVIEEHINTSFDKIDRILK